jgi:L-lactate dehydrogenase complex protein LldG
MSIKETTTKEKILTSIRNALLTKKSNPFGDVNFDSEVFSPLDKEDKEVVFASNLLENEGKFVYCESEENALEILKALIKEKGWGDVFAFDNVLLDLFRKGGVNVTYDENKFLKQKAGVTRCEFLIARFGSVMVSSALGSGRRMFVYPETHIVFAYASQVVMEISDALAGIKKKYKNNLPSQISVITGPSRTADIEKTLVMGAHGPKELYVFFIDNIL